MYSDMSTDTKKGKERKKEIQRGNCLTHSLLLSLYFRTRSGFDLQKQITWVAMTLGIKLSSNKCQTSLSPKDIN